MEVFDGAMFIKFIFAFIFVISLMFFISWVAKKMGLSNNINMNNAKKRLAISSYMAIDHKHRLYIVKRDDVEHLILIGPNKQTVVEKNIVTDAIKEKEIETE